MRCFFFKWNFRCLNKFFQSKANLITILLWNSLKIVYSFADLHISKRSNFHDLVQYRFYLLATCIVIWFRFEQTFPSRKHVIIVEYAKKNSKRNYWYGFLFGVVAVYHFCLMICSVVIEFCFVVTLVEDEWRKKKLNFMTFSRCFDCLTISTHQPR